MKISRRPLGIIILPVLLVLLYWIGSEVWYGNHIRPVGWAKVSDFYRCFGEPRQVRVVQRDGDTFYHLRGTLPPPGVMAFPSSAPVYVFDSSARFVAWCRDPGDSKTYWQRWPQEGSQTMDPAEFRQRFAP